MSSSIVIRLCSDCHLEFLTTPPRVKPFSSEIQGTNTTVCVLAGDIGYPGTLLYRQFLNQTKQDFDVVLVVAGNHEYYQSSLSKHRLWNMEAVENQIRQDCDDTGCIFLNKTSHTIGNTKFAGCTLWSNIPKGLWGVARGHMNDYEQIRLGSRQISPEDTVNLHHDHVAWLKEQIDETSPDQNLVVVTHHAPALCIVQDRYHSDPMTKCFYTPLNEMIRPPVTAWFSGHTHNSKTLHLNGTECTSNCLGYPSEQKKYGLYREDYFLQL